MKYEGIYKVSKIAKREEDGMVFYDIDKLLAETADEAEKLTYMKTKANMLMIDADANIKNLSPIPEGTPVEEIEKAKNQGAQITDDLKYVVTKTTPGKFEDEKLYLHDASTFMTGKEWVEISTDTEDELNLVAMIYKRI